MERPGPDETTGADPGAAGGRTNTAADGAPHAPDVGHRRAAGGRCGGAVARRPRRGAAGRPGRDAAARPGGRDVGSAWGVRGRAGGVAGAGSLDATDGVSGSPSAHTRGGKRQATLRRAVASLSAAACPGLVPRRGARAGEGAR
ncbi:DUF6380 family protein [Streptomyces sp.]|uniref:DUF6380 family protein n=1 Tax=Streptomyces sp. TaxID=1931 RepID=UPI0039C9EEC3